MNYDLYSTDRLFWIKIHKKNILWLLPVLHTGKLWQSKGRVLLKKSNTFYLSNSWTRKVVNKVLEEQFLLTFLDLVHTFFLFSEILRAKYNIFVMFFLVLFFKYLFWKLNYQIKLWKRPVKKNLFTIHCQTVHWSRLNDF